jgi:hypothetical protein
MRRTEIKCQTVDFIPEQLQEGVLYISLRYATAAHKCCCGCGQEVITPLTPTDWSISFDGKVASLTPSIGNWSFPCRSHYWISKNKVVWAGQMSQRQIKGVRARDRAVKQRYFDSKDTQHSNTSSATQPTPTHKPQAESGLLDLLRRWFGD